MSRGRIEQAKGGTNESFLPWLSPSSLGSVVPPSAQSFLPWLSRSSLGLFVILSSCIIGSQNEGTQSAHELLVTKIV